MAPQSSAFWLWMYSSLQIRSWQPKTRNPGLRLSGYGRMEITVSPDNPQPKKEATSVPYEKNNDNDQIPSGDQQSAAVASNSKVKFEIYGEEMIEKLVKSSGNSGRVYLPPNWVGHRVKIIRM